MQAQSTGRLLRGGTGIMEHIRKMQAGGTPVSRAAVYRWIESGKIPVFRQDPKGEVWTTTDLVDQAFGLAPRAVDQVEDDHATEDALNGAIDGAMDNTQRDREATS